MAAGAASRGQCTDEEQENRAGGEQAVRVHPCCALCKAPLSPAEVHAAARRRAAAAAAESVSGADSCTASATPAVTAAAAAVSTGDRSDAVGDGGHGVAQGQGGGGGACGGSRAALEVTPGRDADEGSAGGMGAAGDGGEGEDEEDTGAGVFCASCRTQIFFTPAQAAMMAGRAAGREGVGGVVAHGAPAVDERVSRVLPLLPPCLR